MPLAVYWPSQNKICEVTNPMNEILLEAVQDFLRRRIL
jgi:hypothetical protein